MPLASRKLLIGIAAVLGICTLVGALYGQALLGLCAGALLSLLWQLRLMLIFERSLRTNNFEDVRYTGGFWAQAYSRLSKVKTRGSKHKRRYRRLLREVRKSTNAMPDGAIILDDNFEIVLCNVAAQDLVGIHPRLDRGQRVDHILRTPEFVRYLKVGEFNEAIEMQSPLHDDHWLFLQIVPYGENQRLLIIRDVTDRVRLNKMRRDFVANASHELRSPLTVINGYLDALATDTEVPDGWQRPLLQMQDQAQRMRQIIEELIELSRLETSGSAPVDADVDVPAILARVQNRYSDDAKSAEVIVVCKTDVHLQGSATDIESVVTNLLSNAVRHTPEDGQVTAVWDTCEEGVALTVTDTGEGIPAQYIERLTERFFRVDRGRARADGGIGLGLAIVKYALSRHDAELEISSTVGEGSTFRCVFPQDRIMVPPSQPLEATSGA